MIKILCMGQSNDRGKGLGGIFPCVNNVKTWNNQNDIDTLAALGNAFVTPDRNANPFVNGWNNMHFHACRYFADMLGEEVRMILVAKGGLPISQWDKATGPMYARTKAVLQAAGVSSVDAVLWGQGASDDPAPSGYTAAYGQLLADLEADGLITSCTPVVVGEQPVQYSAINAVLRGLEGGRIKCARLSTLPTFDETHFTGTGLVMAGWQYAKCLHDLFLTPWEPFMDFVSAAGFQAQTFPSGVDAKIPVMAVAGDPSWIANGSFVCQRAGLYKISARNWVAGGKARLKLLDAAGDQIEQLAYMGSQDVSSNNAVLSGEAVLDLALGDVVSLGGAHLKGVSSSITADNSAAFNRLSVQLIGAYE